MAKKKTRRRFTDEFKAETVKLVRQSDRTMASIAMELGISAKSVGEWVRRADEAGDGASEDERAKQTMAFYGETPWNGFGSSADTTSRDLISSPPSSTTPSTSPSRTSIRSTGASVRISAPKPRAAAATALLS